MNKDIENRVAFLNNRLGTELEVSHATCYGGYRLEDKHGSTGFAYNNGTEARMECKAFKTYLDGIHDALHWMDLNKFKYGAKS